MSEKDIYNNLSKEFGMPPHIIERIAKSQFRYIAHVMRSKTLDPVRLHHLGVFAVKPSRLKYLKENGCIKDTSSQ